jgi:hypothetical protein
MRKALGHRRLWEVGGIVAGAILIAFGAVSIWMGATGVNTVRDNLGRENIQGTGETSVGGYTVPEGELVNTGSEARAFADLMRTHALDASGGLVYADMGRYQSAANPDDPAGTSDPAAAVTDQDGNPVPNAARDTWVTQTALSTALNQAYFGERVATFGIVVGIALLLAGIGFTVLAVGGALRHREGIPAGAPAGDMPPVELPAEDREPAGVH